MKREMCFKVCAFSDKSLTPVYFYFKGESKVNVLNTLNIWFLKQSWLFVVAPFGRSCPKEGTVLSNRKEVNDILNKRLLEVTFANKAFDVATFRDSIRGTSDEKNYL